MMVLTSSLFAKNDTDYVGRVGVRTDAIRFNKQGYLVVTGSGTWVVVWNQSAVGEAAGDHRIVSSRSPDRGKTWSEPHIIERDRQGCWLSPVYVETQNRIYGFYWHDADGNPIRDAGVIVFRYSDDEGVTWSPRFPVPMARHAIDVLGKPYHGWNFNPAVMLEDDTCWMNFNKINPDSMVKDPQESKCLIKLYNNLCWTEAFFLVCPNIATESDPAKLEFRVSPESPHGLHATHPLNGQNCGDEASVVPLSNGDLYATFLTPTGRPYCAVSQDRGRSWGGVRPMTFTPGGKPILQPNCSCPLVKLKDGRFVFSFNNNPGDANGGTDPWDTRRNRSPLWVAVGREIATQEGELDLEFDRPRSLIANDLSSGGTESTGITYTQVFEDRGEAFIIYTNKSDDVNINRIEPNLLQFGAKVTIPDDQISWLEKRIETLRSQIGSHRQDMGYTHFFHNLDAAMAEQDYFHAYHLTLNRTAWLIESRDDWKIILRWDPEATTIGSKRCLGTERTQMFDGPRKYAIAKESTVDVDIDYPILSRLSDGRLVVISGRYFTQEGKAFGHRRLYISENGGNSWEWVPVNPERPGAKYPVWDIPLPLTHEFEDGEGFCVLGTFPTRSPSDMSHIPIILNRFKNGSVEREEGDLHIPDRMDDSDGITDICTVFWDQVLQLSDGSLICPMDARLKGDDAIIDRENFEIAGSIAIGMDRWAFTRVIIIRSEDRGRTWKMCGNVGTVHQDEGLNESSLRLTPTGDLVIVMRLGHQSPLHIAWSSDRGQTWTDPVPTPFPTGTLPKLTVLEDGSLVLLHGVQSIIPPEVTEQVNDVRPSLNLKFKYRMGEVNLGVSRDGTGKKWDEIGNVLTWPNTTGNGGILTTGPNSVGLVFDMRGYRTRQGKFAFCVVKYIEVDLGKTMWP